MCIFNCPTTILHIISFQSKRNLFPVCPVHLFVPLSPHLFSQSFHDAKSLEVLTSWEWRIWLVVFIVGSVPCPIAMLYASVCQSILWHCSTLKKVYESPQGYQKSRNILKDKENEHAVLSVLSLLLVTIASIAFQFFRREIET